MSPAKDKTSQQTNTQAALAVHVFNANNNLSHQASTLAPKNVNAI